MVDWDIEVDFVSVGSGIGGLAGAIAAHDSGLDVLVLEKAPVIGGCTGYSYGQVWVPDNPVMRAAGLPDSAAEGEAYLDGLEATVERFNADAAAGEDTEWGRGSWPRANWMFGDLNCKPNANLGPLLKPPFSGFEVHSVGVGVNSAGLRIDTEARVRHVRGHPIPGLYAAGGTAAWRDIGSGYQSGIANARGMIWGYLAGRHAGR